MHDVARPSADTPVFLAGGGEMGALMRALDWAATPLGSPETWPQPLRTALRLLLNTGHPMYVWWGPELLCFYNDAYRATIGPERHPGSLGRPGREVWEEIWPIIGSQIEQVMSGGSATWHENQLVPITRHGHREDVYWTYSYGPIDDEAAPTGVGGVLVVCTETTEQVLAAQSARAHRERLARMFDQAPGFMAMLVGPEHVFEFTNAAFRRLFGNRDLVGKTAREGFPELEGQGFYELLDQVYATGERFVAQHVPIRLERPGGQPAEELVLDFIYEPVTDAAGRVTGIFCEGHDVTKAQRAEAELRRSEERFRLMADASPQIMWIIDAEGRTEFFNQHWANYVGVPNVPPTTGAVADSHVHPDDQAATMEAFTEARRTGTTFQVEHRIRSASGDYRWFLVRAEPYRDPETGEIMRWFGASVDIHDRRQAEQALRESEERLRFLTGLDDALRASRDAPNAMQSAAKLLAGHLGASRCAYADVDADNDRFVIRSDYSVPGLESSAGTYSLDLFGSRAAADMRSGRTLVVRDVSGELAPNDGREMFLSIGISAIVCCPLVKDGQLVAMMAVHQVAPRDWQAGEIALVEAVVERCWAHVERVAAEARLGETSRRLNAILANTREAVFLMDERQQCVFANAAAEKLTGYSFGQMKGRPLHDVIHHKKPDGSHYPLEECPIDRAFPERAQMSGEELFVALDGSFYPVAFTASPVLDDEGKPIGTVIEARDISAERAANERLAQLAAVSEQSLDFIGVADLQGRPVYVNEAGRAMVGLPSLEAACAVSLLDYFAPGDRETIRTQALPAVGSEGYWEGEVAFRRFDDGGEFPVLYNIFPVRNAAGEVTHYATVTRDLTEKKNVEAELRSLNATLEARVEERTRDLMVAEEALRQSQKMEAVGQLTGGLAHDFNNLLAGISGSLELMGTRITQGRLGDVERYMVAAQGATRRAAALTHRLLAFSRRQTLAPKVTDVNGLVVGMEDLIRRTVGPEIAVESALGGGIWTVLVDAPQLENALLNLAINARDAMPEGGKLTIETGNRWLDERAAQTRDLPPGQYVSLCVSDNGTGMAADVIARAFDPFFTTKPLGVGTGLGLSMVYGFARQSGGQARIYSEVGQGTMVCLYLPRHLGEAGGADTDGAEGPAAAPAQAGETVLVIDDEPVVRMLIVDVLEELGYGALEASDGPEGLKVLQSKARVDLLVTDVGLPGGLNGRQVADAARVLRPALKVLFITGYAENAVLNHGHLEHGMQVVTKPFAVEELARRIRGILSDG